MRLKLEPDKNIHFVGIGGTGMSGLAKIIHSLGYMVSGSDNNENNVTVSLAQNGINIFYKHNPGNIPSNTQLVVRSAAITEENPEIFTANTKNIPVVKYATMLGYIMDLKYGIAVSGTHGKTTTTSQIAFVLKESDWNPGYVIGGIVPQLNGSSNSGSGDYFVAEACEYDRSFHNLHPKIGIINNIEEDHLDYYKDIEEIKESFNKFAENIKSDGTLIYFNDCINTREVIKDINRKKISYGTDPSSDYYISDIKFNNQGYSEFSLTTPDSKKLNVEIGQFGLHNIINATACIAVCREIGLEYDNILENIKKFHGIKRRFEVLSDKTVKIVDDYAHHPTEIRTVLKYTREKFSDRRIIVVFQPHQHSRTRFLLEDFALSFKHADIIIVPDIYFVRDTEIEKKNISSKDLVKKIVENKGNAFYIPAFTEIYKFLMDNIIDNDIILFMGAGNINEIAYKIKNNLEE